MNCQYAKGLLIIENNHYRVVLSTFRGGSLTGFQLRDSAESPVKREGCEVRDLSKAFLPYHYEQEYGGIAELNYANFKYNENSSSNVTVNVKSTMGMPAQPSQTFGQCENNWVFKEESPLIFCHFKISQPEQIRSHFKKYIVVKPHIYTGWAYKRDDGGVVSGLMRRTKSGMMQEKEKELFSLPKWVTFFNQSEGVAMIRPHDDLWRGEEYWFNMWGAKTMDELLYACIYTKKEVELSIYYLIYATTPELKHLALEKEMEKLEVFNA